MYFAPFRYLMPGAGRWLTRDPLGFVDGLNVYGYGRNNPVRHVDTMGLDCGIISAPTAIALGTAVSLALAWYASPKKNKDQMARNLNRNLRALGGALAQAADSIAQMTPWELERKYRQQGLTPPTIMRGGPSPDPSFNGGPDPTGELLFLAAAAAAGGAYAAHEWLKDFDQRRRNSVKPGNWAWENTLDNMRRHTEMRSCHSMAGDRVS